jgi:hypothetical protein
VPWGAFVKIAIRRRVAAIVASNGRGNPSFIAIATNEKNRLVSKQRFTLILNDKAIRHIEIY